MIDDEIDDKERRQRYNRKILKFFFFQIKFNSLKKKFKA
jgi:hypothetical protein